MVDRCVEFSTTCLKDPEASYPGQTEIDDEPAPSLQISLLWRVK